jgi:hypothetical protein
MERPVELRSLGQAVALDFIVEELPHHWVRVTFSSIEDGSAYEQVRVVMPRSLLERLSHAEVWPLADELRTHECHLQ